MCTCTKCEQPKPLSDFPYRTSRRGKRVRRKQCKSCVAARMREWRAANLDYLKKRDKEYRTANKAQRYELSKAWRRRNRDRMRIYAKRAKLKKNFGISLEEYEAIVKQQECRCGICGGKDPGGPVTNNFFAVDHDHDTKVIRGLLCFSCNTGLGHFRDDIRLLRKAVQYLQGHANKEVPLRFPPDCSPPRHAPKI